MERSGNQALPIDAHRRENWFPKFHAMACLGGTYTAFTVLILLEPMSISNVPLQVFIPAGILLPFFASFVAFVFFAPLSFVLYRLMERFALRNLCCHCIAGVLCVALTLAVFFLGTYIASRSIGSPNPMEESGLDAPANGRLEPQILAVLAISSVAGGAAFFFARKLGSSEASGKMAFGNDQK